MTARDLLDLLHQLNAMDALAEQFAEEPEKFTYNPMPVVIGSKRALSQQLASEGFTALYVDGEYVLKG